MSAPRGLVESLARLEARLVRLRAEAAVPDPAPDHDGAVAPVGPIEPLCDPGFERLAAIRDRAGFTSTDLDVLLIALAPEVDLRYAALYAAIEGQPGRRPPTVDLALALVSASTSERVTYRRRFLPDAPLVRHGLVTLGGDPGDPLPVRTLAIDAALGAWLLHQPPVDARTAPFTVVVPAGAVTRPTGRARQLGRAVARANRLREPLSYYLRGPSGSGRRRLAAEIAGAVRAPLVVLDLERAQDAGADLSPLLEANLREAWLRGAIRCLANVDALRPQPAAMRTLLAHLADSRGIVFLTGSEAWRPGDASPRLVVNVPIESPAWHERRAAWKRLASSHRVPLAAAELDALAGAFRLHEAAIDRAFERARLDARQRHRPPAAAPAGPTSADLFTAARAESGHDLATLSRRVEPVYSWAQLVVPDDSLQQLRELCRRFRSRYRVLAEWGFDAAVSGGKATTALFAGPSGTGKTMAAEVIARELALDLYKIDLAGVVSKYIGETEKNLDRIFVAAAASNAILFFDEADALFGKRSEVRDSHDRYANLEIAYLLQKMEEYEGVAILATNLRQNIDDAFLRRLAFVVPFPLPDATSRERIWRSLWPSAVPMEDDVDFGALAERFAITGGNIRNVALAAAFEAAANGGRVTMAHLCHATRREYQKLGRPLSDDELYGTSDVALAGGRV